MDDTKERITKMYETKNIPNIIFHGSNLTYKKTILFDFLKMIYITNENINKYVLIINCSHGKGNIKFIRDNLKHFANIIINNNTEFLFKSIILLNADKLTIDAQSALRRCIEIYNHSTRFFIVVEDKFKLLKPILSRFSDIYCNKKFKYNELTEITNKKIYLLSKQINIFNPKNIIDLLELSNILYNNAYTGDMLMKYIKNKLENNKDKYKFLFLINIYKKEIKNETLIILFCINYIYFRNYHDLENITFI